MNYDEIRLIGGIDFHDIKVNVYYHPNLSHDLNKSNVVWQMRNPETCYQGVMYLNHKTGKLEYPEGAIIPEQTDRDREMLPKYIIVGFIELNDERTKSITSYLESSYLLRNKLS